MSEDPIPTQRNHMLRPPYCLECRVTEGGGRCDYCREKWKQIAEVIKRMANVLASDKESV